MKKHSSKYYYDKNPETWQAKLAYDRKNNKKPKNRRKNRERKRARRALEKEGKVKPFDGKDVDHIRPLAKGGSNGRSNLRVIDKKRNRVLANLSRSRK